MLTQPLPWRPPIRAGDLVQFYRLRSCQTQVSGQRALLYTVLGYLMAPHAAPLLLIVINTLLIAILFMFFGAYNNYWDWRLRGEHNQTQAVICEQGYPPALVAMLLAAPWLVMALLIGLAHRLGLSAVSESSLGVLAILGFAYMTPGVRLKDRPLSFFMAPLWACLLFLQAFTLLGVHAIGSSLAMLCGIIFLFQCYAELLHRLDDAICQHAPVDVQVVSRLTRQLRRVPLLALGGGLIAATFTPLFLNTVLWSLVRLWSLRRLPLERVGHVRMRIWCPAWSLYEFVVYGLASTLHVTRIS